MRWVMILWWFASKKLNKQRVGEDEKERRKKKTKQNWIDGNILFKVQFRPILVGYL